MLRAAATRISHRLRREEGFTLIELLAAMIAGSVVLTALVLLLSVTTREYTRTTTKVDATQRARVELEEIANELHSACVASGVAPIQSGSTGTSLNFVSYFGNAAAPPPYWHDLAFSNGTLTDSLYTVSGTSPNWTQGSLLQTNTLLTNASQNGTTPVFQYFSYEEAPNGSGGYYSDGAGNPYMMLLDGSSSVPGTSPPVYPAASPLGTPLSTSDAQNAVEVVINLMVGAQGGTEENTNLTDVSVPATESVVMRMTPVANHVESGASFGPCQ